MHADEYAHDTHPRELVAQLRADGFEADLDTYTTSLGDPATTLAAAARDRSSASSPRVSFSDCCTERHARCWW